MKRHSPPDIQELTSSLDYDPLTGRFTWKKQRASNCMIGKEAGYITGYGYRQIHFNGKAYKAHRLSWHSTRNRWIVKVTREGREYYGGAFTNFDDAKLVSEKLRKELHGEFYRDVSRKGVQS